MPERLFNASPHFFRLQKTPGLGISQPFIHTGQKAEPCLETPIQYTARHFFRSPAPLLRDLKQLSFLFGIYFNDHRSTVGRSSSNCQTFSIRSCARMQRLVWHGLLVCNGRHAIVMHLC